MLRLDVATGILTRPFAFSGSPPPSPWLSPSTSGLELVVSSWRSTQLWLAARDANGRAAGADWPPVTLAESRPPIFEIKSAFLNTKGRLQVAHEAAG